MQTTQVAWLGSQRSEFSPIRLALQQQTFCSVFPLSIATALSMPAGSAPDAIVYAESHVGEIPSAHRKKLAERWPKSRPISLLGGWGCGQKRVMAASETPILYAHEDPSAILRLLRPACDTSPRDLGLIAIYGRDADYREALADGLSHDGYRTIDACLARGPRTHGVDLVVWETPGSWEDLEAECVQLRQQHPAAKILALRTYPREFERQALASYGVTMLAQPCPLEQLIALLEGSGHPSLKAAA